MHPFPLVAVLIGATLLPACGTLSEPGSSPSSSSSQASAPAPAPLLSVPIERGKRWMAQATGADGHTFSLALDTGATYAVLERGGRLPARPMSEEAHRRFLVQGTLDAPVDREGLTVDTLSGVSTMQAGTTPALRIQGWALPAGEVAVIADLTRFNARTARRIDGILGMEAMRRLVWRADYTAGRLTAYADAAPAHAWQQCTFMTLEPSQRMPVIPYWLDRDSGGFIGIDTGSNGDIAISAQDFDRLDAGHGFDRVGLNWGYGLSGDYAFVRQGLLAGMRFGQRTLPKLTVDRVETAQPQLGMGVLARMDRFELDFRRGQFCFDMAADARDSHVSMLGAALVRVDGAIKVEAVSPDGRLGQIGIRPGDVIASIGPAAVGALSDTEVNARLEDPATQSIGVQRDGKSVGVRLHGMSPGER